MAAEPRVAGSAEGAWALKAAAAEEDLGERAEMLEGIHDRLEQALGVGPGE